MRCKIIFLSFLFAAAAAGCYQTVHFVTPPEDADGADDATLDDGQDLRDQDARPDAPEPPDAVEAVDDGELIRDPRPDDGPLPDDGLQDDVGLDDTTDADAGDGDVAGDASDGQEETFEPYPANDFTLTDYNADSPTYMQDRTLSAAEGKVVVLFFLSYG